MKKTYEISFSNNIETNEFLRCLWSKTRKYFGKTAWNLSPIKIGEKNYIHLGYVDLGEISKNHRPTSVSCKYSKKGCIKSISIENDSLKNPQEFEEKFDNCITEAKKYLIHKKKFYLENKFDKNISFKPFEGKYFTLKENSIIFLVKAYDKKDYESFSQNVIKMIRSFLTFDTLKFISFSGSGIEDLRIKNDRIFTLIDADTNEESFKSNSTDIYKNLKISNFIGKCIDSFLEREIDYKKPFTLFEKSIIHFSQAIFFEKIKNTNFYLDFSPSEHATICYMSSLEIVSLNDILPTKCEKCGQEKYSISKRVINLTEKATKNNHYAKKLISRFYSYRSKFVHTGDFMSTNNYIGVSIPLLSENSYNGIIEQTFNFDTSMKEIVKECIIWHKKNN